jgi:hypothetical protein
MGKPELVRAARAIVCASIAPTCQLSRRCAKALVDLNICVSLARKHGDSESLKQVGAQTHALVDADSRRRLRCRLLHSVAWCCSALASATTRSRTSTKVCLCACRGSLDAT